MGWEADFSGGFSVVEVKGKKEREERKQRENPFELFDSRYQWKFGFLNGLMDIYAVPFADMWGPVVQ